MAFGHDYTEGSKERRADQHKNQQQEAVTRLPMKTRLPPRVERTYYSGDREPGRSQGKEPARCSREEKEGGRAQPTDRLIRTNKLVGGWWRVVSVHGQIQREYHFTIADFLLRMDAALWCRVPLSHNGL